MYHLWNDDPHSTELIVEIHKLAEDAAENDTWMKLTTDSTYEEHADNFTEWLAYEIDEWRYTDHFRIKYGRQLRKMCEADARDEGFDPDEHPVEFGRRWLLPAEQEFMEVWANEVNAHEFWLDNVAA